jgi:hypothetical protein
MKLHFKIGILRDCGCAAQEQDGGEKNEYGESVDTAKSHVHGVPFLHLEYAREQGGVPRHHTINSNAPKQKGCSC